MQSAAQDLVDQVSDMRRTLGVRILFHVLLD
jgi:hypothetical protein